ncbi:cell envelope integrity protein CreD [Comamonas humi]
MFKNRFLVKAAALLITFLLLMSGLTLVQDVVQDRIRNRDNAVQGIVGSLAGPQTLMGPVVVQRCTESWTTTNADKKPEASTRVFRRYAMPDTLEHQAELQMDQRARGLHKVSTYVLGNRIEARFSALPDLLQPAPARMPQARVSCEAPRLILALSDPRGIRNANLALNGDAIALQPGTRHPAYPQGLSAELPPALLKAPLAVALTLELLGTERLAFVPLADSNQVSLAGNWPHPSFGGSFLPSQRSVSDSSFSASWNLSALASSAQQSFADSKPLCPASDVWRDYAIGPTAAAVEVAATAADAAAAASTASGQRCLESFSTTFVDPVNPYALSDRATKYGLLFIVLTFVAVAMFEVLKQLRVHPVQYLLVGSALCSFFLLLIGLSEHIGFSPAYGVAASACVLLLAFYASHILGSARRGLPFAGWIALLYGLLFVLLQLEQTALVVGSIALFAVLAIVMVATRKVDWYAFGKSGA